jgi:hypothetical protein
MIITRLIGGLGNQMFQYAAGLSLARNKETSLKMDICFLLDKSKRYYRHSHRDYGLDIFKISGEIASDKEITKHVVPRRGNKYVYHLLKKIKKQKAVYDEETIDSLREFYRIPSDAYIQGTWQDVRYLKDIDAELRREFEFNEQLPDGHLEIYSKINSENSVCVVFRRGDYVGHPFLDIVGLDFYDKAVEIMNGKTPNPSYYVFSDDIDWCRNNFKPEGVSVCFVDQKYTGPKAQYYLMLMATCKHHIIPNSTYPWWGAWLCRNPEKIVIAPKIWYKGQSDRRNEILMDDWIAI